jgi:hypothetical protein
MIHRTARSTFPWLLLTLCASGSLVAGCSDDEETDGSGASSTAGSGAAGATGSGGSAGSGASGATGGDSSSSQGGGSATGGGGGAGGTMGIDAACGDCLEAQNDCSEAGDACEGDADCGPWIGCIEDCADEDWSSACIGACDAAFPNAGRLKTAVVTCFCAACDSVCMPLCGG